MCVLTGAGSGERPAGRWWVLLVAVVVVLAGSCTATDARQSSLPLPQLTILDGPQASAWFRLLRISGGSAGIGDLSAVVRSPAALVPAQAVLDNTMVGALRRWVLNGGRLATADRSLLDALGIKGGQPVTAGGVAPPGGEAAPGGPVEAAARWPGARTFQPLVTRAGSSPLRPIALAGTAVVVGEVPFGRGAVLASAVDPLAAGPAGYQLLPDLPQIILRWSGLPPGPQSSAGEVYFDPGVLKGSVTAIAAELSWARVVDVAAWDFGFSNPAADYPYRRLIDALHARGVAAYAWLDPPMVSLPFWMEHPGCREKTASGTDAHVGWRYLVALEDPTCFALAWQQWRPLLTGLPWDGVNVAELYFEPGPAPAATTPYSTAALAGFGRQPASDPGGFQRFRTRLVTELNRAMLAQLNGLPDARRLAFELTIVDDRLDPALASRTGTSDRQLAAVARQAGASLEVEDPYTVWGRGPLRYAAIASNLRRLVSPPDALIDVATNAVAGGRPTPVPTGATLDLSIATASLGLGRVAVYPANAAAVAGLRTVPAALAAGAELTGQVIRTPVTVTVRAPGGRAETRLEVDGRLWPAGPGLAVVPAGRHVLRWSRGSPVCPELLRFTAQLATASCAAGRLDVVYSSVGSAFAVVSARPTAVLVGGHAGSFFSWPDPAGGVSVRLPSGIRKVELVF